MTLADTFSSANDFFESGTWLVIRNLLIFFAVVFWLAFALGFVPRGPGPALVFRGAFVRAGRSPAPPPVPRLR